MVGASAITEAGWLTPPVAQSLARPTLHAGVELDHVGRRQRAGLVAAQRDPLVVVQRAAGADAGAVGADVLGGQLAAAQGELHVPAADPLAGVVGQPLAEHDAAALGRAADHDRRLGGDHEALADHAVDADRQHLDRRARAGVAAAGRRAAGRSARRPAATAAAGPPGWCTCACRRTGCPSRRRRRSCVQLDSGQLQTRASSRAPIGDGSPTGRDLAAADPGHQHRARRRRAPRRAAGPARRPTGGGRGTARRGRG